MKKLAIAALMASAFAAPAFADAHARSVAVSIFNASEDMALENIMSTTEPQLVDITMDMTLAEIISQLNMNADMGDDMIGSMVLTIAPNMNLAQDIFDEIMAADDDNN
ncbi:hypothetical protein HKCCE3408_12915 [Rhodobacterales bacterium HKCCE3408]|nr:hypothetical protein [Rhodobacterales bacterium HKCCE3408]